MMNLNVRNESPVDADAIHDVTVAAFLNAPHADHTEQQIVERLRSTGALAISLVADDSGHIVGHVAVSPVSITDGSTGWFGLGPISVLPSHQRHGVGSHLMREALGRLRQQQASGCVVLGDPAYYARFGFAPVPSLVLPGVAPEFFLALSISGRFPHGTVSYHSAFDAR